MKTLCLLKFSALGDLAQLEPFLPTLSKYYEITLFTSPLGYSYFKSSPHIRHFIILPSKKFKDILFIIPKIFKKFDQFVDLQGNDRSKFLSFFSISKHYSNYHKEFKIVPLSNKLKPYIKKDSIYHIDLFSILSMLKIPFEFTKFVPKKKEYIVLNCGSSPKWSSKRLPMSKWKEIANVLHERYRLPFILTGNIGEREYCENIGHTLELPFTNMAGKTTLEGLKDILNNAYLVVSTDSAAMHIAAICSTPTIGLFGPTNWVKSAPFGPWATTLYDSLYYPSGIPAKVNSREEKNYFDTISILPALNLLAPYLK